MFPRWTWKSVQQIIEEIDGKNRRIIHLLNQRRGRAGTNGRLRENLERFRKYCPFKNATLNHSRPLGFGVGSFHFPRRNSIVAEMEIGTVCMFLGYFLETEGLSNGNQSRRGAQDGQTKYLVEQNDRTGTLNWSEARNTFNRMFYKMTSYKKMRPDSKTTPSLHLQRCYPFISLSA